MFTLQKERQNLSCSTIGGTLTVKYGKYESFDMAEIPYSDEDFSLYVIYPHTAESFDQSLTYIQDIGIEKFIDDLAETEMSIRIPTFKFEGVTELNSVSVSSDSAGKQFYQAKLTKASPNGFNITTGTGATPGGGVLLPQMHIVRPFVILIRNNVLKTVVYACSIKDLSE